MELSLATKYIHLKFGIVTCLTNYIIIITFNIFIASRTKQKKTERETKQFRLYRSWINCHVIGYNIRLEINVC